MNSSRIKLIFGFSVWSEVDKNFGIVKYIFIDVKKEVK